MKDSERARRALDRIRLSPLERLVALALARRFESGLSLPELVDSVYGGDADGGPLGADAIVVRASRRLGHKLRATSELRLIRESAKRRLVWRKHRNQEETLP